jgi:hypothetical protein
MLLFRSFDVGLPARECFRSWAFRRRSAAIARQVSACHAEALRRRRVGRFPLPIAPFTGLALELQSDYRTTRTSAVMRLLAQDWIEPIKHSLKKYLACARLAVLASAFTRRKEHVFFGTL